MDKYIDLQVCIGYIDLNLDLGRLFDKRSTDFIMNKKIWINDWLLFGYIVKSSNIRVQ